MWFQSRLWTKLPVWEREWEWYNHSVEQSLLPLCVGITSVVVVLSHCCCCRISKLLLHLLWASREHELLWRGMCLYVSMLCRVLQSPEDSQEFQYLGDSLACVCGCFCVYNAVCVCLWLCLCDWVTKAASVNHHCLCSRKPTRYDLRLTLRRTCASSSAASAAPSRKMLTCCSKTPVTSNNMQSLVESSAKQHEWDAHVRCVAVWMRIEHDNVNDGNNMGCTHYGNRGILP